MPQPDDTQVAALMRRGWRPVPPPERPVLFVNTRSGGGTATRTGLVEHARERGIKAVPLQPGQDLRARALQVVSEGADALGVAGGDGSLADVAAVALARDLPFVCVPVGTRNHFALDIGVDREDVLGALAAFIDGVEQALDVGEVNGRLFLNNVSLGIYGEAVRQAGYRDAKVRTLVETARRVLGPSGHMPRLQVVDDSGRQHEHLAVLLVSNNPYAFAGPGIATRPSLSGSQLGVLAIDTPEDTPHAPGRAWSTPALLVQGAGVVHAGIDGESVELDAPLSFRIRPATLRVRISARHPGASPSAGAASWPHRLDPPSGIRRAP